MDPGTLCILCEPNAMIDTSVAVGVAGPPQQLSSEDLLKHEVLCANNRSGDFSGKDSR